MFNNKNVVITGGSRGIGKGLVEAFAEHGANVIFTYVSNEAAAFDVKNDLEARYPKQTFTAAQCDASKQSNVELFFDQYIDKLESVDVLINNAGITEDSLAVMMSTDSWDKVIQTNLSGCFYLTQKIAFKMLRNKSGNILNISSVAGVYGNVGQTNYAASKAGIIGMSKSLSKELAPRNIRVNVLAPGFIETEMTEKMAENVKKEMLTKISMKKMGQIEDVANAALFLASDQAKYITGQTLLIDGGLAL